MKNRYGVDVSYVKNKLELIVRDIENYTPKELYNELVRTSMSQIIEKNETCLTAHSLARELFDGPDVELTASVDMSSCDDDSSNRVFGTDLCGIQSDCMSPKGTVLLFGAGSKNY